MLKTSKYAIFTIAVLAASISTAFAGGLVPLGGPMGNSVPFSDVGILGLATAGVIGGVWLARRKR